MDSRTYADTCRLAIAIIAFATYWQTVALPLIQDDWVFLYASRQGDLLSLVVRAFDIRNTVLYRPAAMSYLYAVFKLFGETAWPGHALALVIHVVNCLLIFDLMQKLNAGDRITNFVVAGVYASAAVIHLEVQSWLAGIFDLGATLFFLLAIDLFLRRRTVTSLTAYGLSVLFKESAIILPAIVVLIASQPRPSFRKQPLPSIDFGIISSSWLFSSACVSTWA